MAGLKEEILEFMEEMTADGEASDALIAGSLAETKEAVREACDELVDEGGLEFVGERNENKRYRLKG